MPKQSTAFDMALWLALALMWSSSYAVIKIGVEMIDPMMLVAGRMIIGAAVIYAVMRAMGLRLSKSKAVWVNYAVTGLLGSTIPFLFITYGEQSVDSALAAIFMGCTPVATIVLASLVLPDEPLTKRTLLGVGCALAGVVLLVGPQALLGLGADVFSQLAIVAAAICYALSTIYIKLYVRRSALEMAAGSMIFGAVSVGFAAFILGKELNYPVPTQSLFAIVYLGLVSTAAANLIYFYLVPRVGATKMSQVNFAVPVGGTLIGVIALGEELTLDRIIALAIISGAVYLVLTGRKQGAVQPERNRHSSGSG